MSNQDHPEGQVSCRKCGQTITGEAFGSSLTGWEHPLSCPSAWEVNQLLFDLNDRIDRGVMELRSMHPDFPTRVEGKIEGLLLIKDWLRSYG